MGTWQRVYCSKLFNCEPLGTITTCVAHNLHNEKLAACERSVVPCNSLNPFIGTLDVPVTNCNNLARVSLSNVSTACGDRNPHILVCVMCVSACVRACVRAHK